MRQLRSKDTANATGQQGTSHAQVLEALLKEVEKRVPGFQRLQGESLKRACRTYGEMKPGNKWVLQSQFLQPAQDILSSIQSFSHTGRLWAI